MSTPYEQDFRVVTTGVDEIVELDFPGRCEITKINAVRDGGGAIALDFFSRSFTSLPQKIEHVSKVIGGDFDGKARLHFFAEFGVARPGDTIAVAGNSEGAYNTDHIVEALSDDKLVCPSPSALIDRGWEQANRSAGSEGVFYHQKSLW